MSCPASPARWHSEPVRVLVTGGAGFIGSRVVGLLHEAGHDVVCLDSLRPDVHPRGTEATDDARLVHGDVRDRSTVDQALVGVDAVAHLAAKVGLGVDLDDVDDYVSSNDLGTAVLLRQMRRAGVGRLVLASSMVVYGEGAYDCAEHGRVAPAPRSPDDLDQGRFDPACPLCGRTLRPALVDEAAPFDPRNVYAATKVHSEHLCSTWARETDGSAVALRFHNVYGPGMPRDTPYAGVAALFRSALEAGRAPRVFEDGRQRRDFVHVDDVARAVGTALTASAPGGGALRAYNVGSGRVSTIGEVASALAEVIGGPSPVTTGEYRLGDVRHVTASSRRIADELGWRAAIALDDGLATLVAGPVSR